MAEKETVYCFIDASNLFYGGQKSLGWKIDYKKLLEYLKTKYGVNKVFYYGGVELSGFPYSVLDEKPIDLDKLIEYLCQKMRRENVSEGQVLILDKHIARIKFYKKLEKFGYILKLKPVKIFVDGEGNSTKKANCDVDMTFDLMKQINEYDGILVLSGDGDFAVVLNYLKKTGKQVTILARAERTAREIRQLAGPNFRDFNYLRELLKFEEVKK